MDDQNKNLILATVLSFLVILGWYTFFPPPEPAPVVDPAVIETVAEGGTAGAPAVGSTAATDATATAQAAEAEAPSAPRIDIDTPRLSGSISLQGGRIDDLSLKDYRVEIDADAAIVKMLSPVGAAGAYYALYGWAPGPLCLDLSLLPYPFSFAFSFNCL